MMNRKFLGGMFLIFVIIFLSLVSATYTRSTTQTSQFSFFESEDFDESMCRDGQDFIIQIAPFGCTPAVIRSDLLEENDVPVFCQLAATKINPLIDVEAIDSISFSGQYPDEVSEIGFHPAKSALGVEGDLNTAILENIGYVVINLKKQLNESSMPDSISGTLTANIKYDIDNAFGIGDALFYLPEISDNDEWDNRKNQYSFWNGKGYLRAEDIGIDEAYLSVYSENGKISNVKLEKGETSDSVYLPGFDCQAGLKLKLDDLENPTTRAKLRVNAEVIEVAKGEKFLDNKCSVRDLKKEGIVQTVNIRCQEDGKTNSFNLIISPKVILNIDGEEREAAIGNWLYNDGDKSVYLGYVGTRGDSEDLFVYFVSMPEEKDKLNEEEIESVNSLVGDLIITEQTSSGIIDDISESLELFSGTSNLLYRFIGKGQSFYRINSEDKDETVFGKKVSIIGFAEPVDSELSGEVKENYENAREDYETIVREFSSEVYTKNTASTFGEEALYKEIILAWDANQKRTVSDLCKEFEEDYPNSDKSIKDYCGGMKLSNEDVETVYVTFNGNMKKISFDGIYEPSFEEFGAKVLIRTPDSVRYFYLRKNDVENLEETGTDYIQLVSLDDSSAQIRTSLKAEKATEDILKEFNSDIITLEKDVSKSFGDYSFTLSEVNLKKTAKVSVSSNINNAGTQANFSFKVGIEKRAFSLSPGKIKEKIEELNDEISRWQGISDSLGGIIKGLKTSCLVAGAVLVLKNFASNLKGEGIARQEVMRGSGGWNERCADLVSQGVYSSQQDCYKDNADEIDEDVDLVTDIISEQNSQIEELEEDVTDKKFLGDDIVDTGKFMEEYTPHVSNYLDENFDDSFEDPSGVGETIDKEEILTILSSDYNEGRYTTQQVRDIELYSTIINDPDASDELKESANERLYSELLDIKTASENYAQLSDWAGYMGVSSGYVSSLETGGNVKKLVYEGLTNGDIGNIIPGEDSNTPVALIQTFPDGKQYILVLDDSSGTSQMPIKNLDGINPGNNQLAIYDSLGNLVENPSNELRNIYFEKYDSSSYQNNYKNAELRCYETDPYKGLPAIVPFDLKNGWYAAMKQTLATGSNIASYDASARVNSFYLCNVGGNGLEEFQTIGDDTCQMINTGTGMAYNQFPGLSEDEAQKKIDEAIDAIEEGSTLCSQGASGIVNINGEQVEVGSPATDVPDYECQDFMSPKECLLLFNLCDPVVCPSSRCDLGGAYPVQNVIQSGIIGSIVLCLPNIKEGVIIPVCLTGIKAGIDGFLSVKESYRDCLQESLDTGQLVGLCDEVYSLYICDFFWRQALPLAQIIIPKVLESLTGQDVRGGGEYLTVQDSFDNAESSVDYLTDYYGANVFSAFQGETLAEIGGEVCKSYVSGVYPEGGDIVSSLTELDSPVQFHGRFDEIPFSTVTNPPTSQYKVFYHVYAGENSGAYYKVYLRGSSTSSYYQDTSQTIVVASGYVSVGGYASETKDFVDTSGYKELCINVNGQEECGFQEVSTSFALNYVEDKYLQSQATQTDITKESECISGSTSAYSLLDPNLQSSAEEIINPAIYNEGIVRICATDNPGEGTDPYAGIENSRWVEVGYCDNEKIKCWLDTQSVEDVITTTTIEEDALETVSETYLEILMNEGDYLTEEEFSSAIEEIESGELEDKMDLIGGVLEKVFWSSEKVQLLYLRANAYAELLRLALPKTKQEAEITTEEETETETGMGEEIGGEEITSTEENSISYNVWKVAKDYADAGYNHVRSDGSYTNVCASFVTLVLNGAGANIQCAGEFIPNLITEFESRDDFIEIYKDELQKGDVVIFASYHFSWEGGDKNTQHITIFSNYNEDKTRIYAYGDPSKDSPIVLENRAIYEDAVDYLYFYRAFRYVGEDYEKSQRTLWTIDSALEKVNAILRDENYGGGYTTYSSGEEIKRFVNEICEDQVLPESDCEFNSVAVGVSRAFRTRYKDDEKNMEELKEILLEQKASSN